MFVPFCRSLFILLLAGASVTWAHSQDVSATAKGSPQALPVQTGPDVSAATPIVDPQNEQALLQNIPIWPTEQLEAILDAASDLSADPLIVAVTDEILRRNPNHPDALRERLGVQLRTHDAAAAQQTAAHLAALIPTDPDVWAAVADAWDLSADSSQDAAHHLATALQREKSLRGRTFSRDGELAAAWEKGHQWDKARDAWLAVTAFSGTPPTLAREAWERVDDIETHRLPAARVESRWLHEDEGTLFMIGTADEVTLIDDTRFTFFAESSWLTDRCNSSRWPENGAGDRQDYRLGLSGKWGGDGRWALSGGIGVQRETRGLAAGEIGWTWKSGATLRLSGAWNDRAEDSLPLIWLDGRQHKAEARAELPLTDRLTLELAGFWRAVDVEGQRLGTGGGIDSALNFQAWKKGSNTLTLGYEWEWRRFEFDGDVALENSNPHENCCLVLEKANRHRAALTFEHECGSLTLSSRTTAGYRFECRDPEFSTSAAISWRMSDRSRATLGYDWDSASRTAATSGQSHSVYASLRFAF